MTHLIGKERSRYVSDMFGRILDSYDRMNRLMTFGQDLKWRKEAVALLELETSGLVIDLGAGTGDITLEIKRQHPKATVIGLDFTFPMLKHASKRTDAGNVHWVMSDVHHLPFPSDTFSGTISGFLMRNLPTIDPVLIEQHRVLQGDGKLVCLETSPLDTGFFKSIITFYIQRVIPRLGKIISKDQEAYSYLAHSTEKFLTAKRFCQRIRAAGFESVGFVRRMLGTIAIHVATKNN